MDDFDVNLLHYSKNEWCLKLVNILTPLIIDGYKSILSESIKLCNKNNEEEKYLMTFQNFISRIPKWNQSIIETETKRILEKSGCEYLEDIITCVHIIQLKTLTAMRVGNKQKKIDINIPKLDEFIHKTYINVARKIYKNIYLYEQNIALLEAQKNNREIEKIIEESIINTIRDSIPIEMFLKVYMDETVEEDVTEEIKEDIIEEPIEQPIEKPIQEPIEKPIEKPIESQILTSNNSNEDDTKTKISFNDIDSVKNSENEIINVEAPKTIDRLEEISEIRNQQRKEEEECEEENEKISISNENISLGDMDVHVLYEPKIDVLPDLLLNDVEVLT